MQELSKNKAGLTLGLLSAVSHLLWVITILAGVADSLLSWWKSYHFINPSYTMLPFNLGTAFLGIVTAFIVGYVVGWLFAWIYNRL